MTRQVSINLAQITHEGTNLPPEQVTGINFWPSGGHEVEVLTNGLGNIVTVLFRDKGWTRKDVKLEITGDNLTMHLKAC
jgi:hypothetical protein